MSAGNPRARGCATGRAIVVLAAVLSGVGGGHAARADVFADRFHLAPETTPGQDELVDLTVNGIGCGTVTIRVVDGAITLPAATVVAAHLIAPPGRGLSLAAAPDMAARLDEAAGTLSLTVPASRLAPEQFAPDRAEATRISPEDWGVLADYDLNVRRALLRLGPREVASTGATTGSESGLGGIVDLRGLGPDLTAVSGWAYDSEAVGGTLIRLEDTIAWRPTARAFSVSAGDLVSAVPASLSQGRSYRFGGVAIGTDHSGSPGWSDSPIPSVSGTAQAQSAVDVYLDGQRTYHADTPGGPFSLQLPEGSGGPGTSVVLTDVTGRSVLVPIAVPLVDARLIRDGALTWSAGLGAPRFGYGSARTRYDPMPYGYANVTYGAARRTTVSGHTEAGPGLAEGEISVDQAVSRRIAAHLLVAGSDSARGAGGAGRFAIVVQGPAGLSVQGAAERSIAAYADVVSVSGRAEPRFGQIGYDLSRPPRAEVSGALAWQPRPFVSVAAGYEEASYAGTSSAGFASVNATWEVAGRIPLFANLSHATGGDRSTSIVFGISLALGGVQASVAAGGSEGAGIGSGTAGRGGAMPSGNLSASLPLGPEQGDLGWDVYASRANGTTFGDAEVRMNTGYAVPGVALQTIGRQATGLGTLRGTVGVIDRHPFLADPSTGGVIVADVGLPGVPVQLNGYDSGRSSFDGKIALPGTVSGVPQHVSIDTSRMPIDAVPGDTEADAVVRDGGATTVAFGVRTADASAIVDVRYHGAAPPIGSTLSSATAEAPISKEGRAYLSSLARDEVLRVRMLDGRSCSIRSRFDGKGGVGRRLGVLNCEDDR